MSRFDGSVTVAAAAWSPVRARTRPRRPSRRPSGSRAGAGFQRILPPRSIRDTRRRYSVRRPVRLRRSFVVSCVGSSGPLDRNRGRPTSRWSVGPVVASLFESPLAGFGRAVLPTSSSIGRRTPGTNRIPSAPIGTPLSTGRGNARPPVVSESPALPSRCSSRDRRPVASSVASDLGPSASVDIIVGWYLRRPVPVAVERQLPRNVPDGDRERRGLSRDSSWPVPVAEPSVHRRPTAASRPSRNRRTEVRYPGAGDHRMVQWAAASVRPSAPAPAAVAGPESPCRGRRIRASRSAGSSPLSRHYQSSGDRDFHRGRARSPLVVRRGQGDGVATAGTVPVVRVPAGVGRPVTELPLEVGDPGCCCRFRR